MLTWRKHWEFNVAVSMFQPHWQYNIHSTPWTRLFFPTSIQRWNSVLILTLCNQRRHNFEYWLHELTTTLSQRFMFAGKQREDVNDVNEKGYLSCAICCFLVAAAFLMSSEIYWLFLRKWFKFLFIANKTFWTF